MSIKGAHCFAAAALTLASCATTPVAPDPTVNLVGDWRVTAVSGVATPTRLSGFNFRYAPPFGSVQFGCNWGSGSASAQNGWFVTGNWIITAAGCSDERVRFERQGFEILSKPLAIEAAGPDRVRLKNERGSLTLERHLVPQLAGTRWRLISINGIAPISGGSIRFTPASYQANFGCNDVAGDYRQEGNRFSVRMSRQTERGCLEVAPSGLSLSTYEQWGANVLTRGVTTISSPRAGQLQLANATGTILLERVP